MLEDVKRVAQGGIVPLTEDTDTTVADAGTGCATGVTAGRSGETYAAWMAPFTQVLPFRRQIDPGSPKACAGSYRMFLDAR